MEKQYHRSFTPANEADELLMLAGRIEAVGAYIENEKYPDAKIIAEMLGIDLKHNKESD